MTRPLIKYKFGISVPDVAGGFQQQWTGEANAWDMQNAVETILEQIGNAAELFRLAGLEPEQLVASTKPDAPSVMILSFTADWRPVNLSVELI